MPPAIAFCDVNDLIRFIEPGDGADVERLAMGRPDECLGLLVDQVARLTGVGIDFDQPESLVAAVGFFVREMAAVFPPAHPRPFKINAVDLGLGDLLRFDIEEGELICSEFVAGQGIRPRPHSSSTAAGRRRLNQINFFAFARLGAE